MNVSEIESYIEKAKKYLKTANHLLEYGDYDSSVSRAYYSMYYSTRAILLSKDLTPKTHSGLLSLFGKYFIKSDILPKKLAKYLRKGFEARLLGDYNVSVRIQKENAQDLIKNTKRFNDAILDYLREKSIISNL